jgi:hypothetical protein
LHRYRSKVLITRVADDVYVRTIPTQVVQLTRSQEEANLALEGRIIGQYFNSSSIRWTTDPHALTWPGGSTTIPDDYVVSKQCSDSDLKCIASGCDVKTLAYDISCAVATNCSVGGYEVPASEALACGYIPASSAYGWLAIATTCVIFTILSAYAAIAWIFAGHKLIRVEYLPFELCTLMAAIIAVLATLCNIGERISSPLCVAAIWMDLWPVFVVWTMLLDKMHELSLLIKTMKPGIKWDMRRRLLWIGGANVPLVCLLTLLSVLNPPQSYELVYKFDGEVPVHFPHYGCSYPSWTALNLLYGYMDLILLYGLYITSRAFGALTLATTVWNNQKSTRKLNIRLTAYATYFLSAFLLITSMLTPLLAEQSGWQAYLFGHTTLQAAVVCVTMSTIWAPKVCAPYHARAQRRVIRVSQVVIIMGEIMKLESSDHGHSDPAPSKHPGNSANVNSINQASEAQWGIASSPKNSTARGFNLELGDLIHIPARASMLVSRSNLNMGAIERQSPVPEQGSGSVSRGSSRSPPGSRPGSTHSTLPADRCAPNARLRIVST